MKERDIQGAVLASESRDVTRGEVGSPRGSKRNLLIASSQSKFDGASGNKTATRVTPRGDSGGGEGWGRGNSLGWKNSAGCIDQRILRPALFAAIHRRERRGCRLQIQRSRHSRVIELSRYRGIDALERIQNHVSKIGNNPGISCVIIIAPRSEELLTIKRDT